MGLRGPVGKDPDMRLGHDMGEADSVSGTFIMERGEKIAPPPCPEHWHPYAQGWYRSLTLSGQSASYEASDWAMAFLGGEILDRELSKPGGRIYANNIAVFMELTVRLCCTLGDRRRMKIELKELAGMNDPDDEASVSSLADYRKRFGA